MERRQSASSVDEAKLESAHVAVMTKDYAADWHQVYIAVNNLMSLLLTVAYLLGLIILWSL
jgi:hypothetical protein